MRRVDPDFLNPFMHPKKKNHYDKIRFVMVTRQTFMIENNSLILTKKNYALVLIVRKNYVYQHLSGSKNVSKSQIMICEYSM